MSILENFDRNMTNLSVMLVRLGIEPAVFAQQQFGSLFTVAMGTCRACPAGEVCHEWLEWSGERRDQAPAFCPNARRFEHVKQILAGMGKARRQP